MAKKKRYDYNPRVIEPYWQNVWEKKKIFSPNIRQAKRPFYNLMMFPYPSAEGLHVGNMYAFTGVDIYGRYKRMQGYEVFEPIGLDGFGIHSENYALKVNRHPKEQAKISEKNFYRQLRATGNAYDWQRTLETYDPDYYRWTQWIFIKMFKAGLAYKAEAPVNWCPSCKTVLADEQVVKKLKVKSQKLKISGKESLEEKQQESVAVCERCETEVTTKKLSQWFFRIASGKRPDGISYPDALLNNLKEIDWVEKVKTGQRNWIGRKEGINIRYRVEGLDEEITCFTTRPDTNFGATFIVLGPEHPFVDKILRESLLRGGFLYSSDGGTTKVDNSSGDECKKQQFVLKPTTIEGIRRYVTLAKKKKAEERIVEGAKKTGVFTGFYAINDLNGKKLPIWISDFVLGDVGTGAVVGVPGHDIRDFHFAKTFGLPIIRVVVGSDGDTSPITREDQVQEEEGTMINSEFLNGLDIHQATSRIMDYLEKKGLGKRVVHYHLRDWLISRQRYWGAPIPMIYCKRCAQDVQLQEGFKVLIIHGTWGHSKENWFPWLKESLERRGVNVAVPDLPDSKVPDYDKRMAFLEENYGDYLNKQTVVIGHSSGASTALHLAEKYQLRQVILVAPVVMIDDVYEKELVDAFDHKTAKALRVLVTREVDISAIQGNVPRITGLFGGKDPYIPERFSELFQKNYPSARINIFPYKQHFSASTDGTVVFPEIFDFMPPIGQVKNPGWYPVPEQDLPVLLPDVKDWKPKGTEKAPLASVPEFVKTTCPYCGQNADRETDVCDTFLDSSWYFLRYPSLSSSNSDKSDSSYEGRIGLPWDPEITKKWLPVNMYIGGAEHTVLHLLYARFITMALHDMGYLHFEEPFKTFRAHGLLISEGAKMSKSRGNVVNPDDHIKKYGADTLRMYLMFLGPFENGGDFQDKGVIGIVRFLNKVWKLVLKSQHIKKSDRVIVKKLHQTIKKVGEDIERLKFNTAIAALMELSNEWEKGELSFDDVKMFLKLLAPFAPHMTEELWQRMQSGVSGSIHFQPWPKYDTRLVKEETVEFVIQVNGKIRDKIEVQSSILQCSKGKEHKMQSEIEKMAKKSEKVQKYLKGRKVKKTIFVPGRLINFVLQG